MAKAKKVPRRSAAGPKPLVVAPDGRRYITVGTSRLTRGEALELAACIIAALSRGEQLPRR